MHFFVIALLKLVIKGSRIKIENSLTLLTNFIASLMTFLGEAEFLLFFLKCVALKNTVIVTVPGCHCLDWG